MNVIIERKLKEINMRKDVATVNINPIVVLRVKLKLITSHTDVIELYTQ